MNKETLREAESLNWEIEKLEQVKSSFDAGKPDIALVFRFLIGDHMESKEWNNEFVSLLKERIENHLQRAKEKFEAL
jgi:hypothetical protein